MSNLSGGIIPTAQSTDTGSVFALLKVVADPLTHQKRLEELAAAEQSFKETARVADKSLVSSYEASKRLSDAMDAHTSAVAKFTEWHDSETARLSALSNSLDTRQTGLDAALSTHQARIAAHNLEMTRRNDELTARESVVSKREQEVAHKEADADQLRAALETRNARIKAALG